MGLIMLISFVVVWIKIYKTSKSKFAYTLIVFTCGYSLCNILQFFINAFPMLVKTNYYYPYEWPACINVQFNCGVVYLSYLLALQGWIFAVKYVECAIMFRSNPIITVQRLKIVFWAVTACYISLLSVSAITFYVSYPG
jgi:hypothetical protein